MAYFPNGLSGESYERQVCAFCVHHEGCTVWLAHLIHNYDQIIDGETVKDHPLQILIPDGEDGHAQLCTMFYSDNAEHMAKAKANWANTEPERDK